MSHSSTQSSYSHRPRVVVDGVRHEHVRTLKGGPLDDGADQPDHHEEQFEGTGEAVLLTQTNITRTSSKPCLSAFTQIIHKMNIIS